LGDAEEEISLRNFYYDLEDRHPQMTKYMTSNANFEEQSPIKVERIVVPESLRNENDLKKLLAQQQDTLEEEELD
jgi:thiamine pyrophosphokinase